MYILYWGTYILDCMYMHFMDSGYLERGTRQCTHKHNKKHKTHNRLNFTQMEIPHDYSKSTIPYIIAKLLLLMQGL
jgi:hypothetical protein